MPTCFYLIIEIHQFTKIYMETDINLELFPF